MDKMVFFKVGWMNRYRGLNGDRIKCRDAFVRKHGFGHEMYNGQPWRGRMYGYVQANAHQSIAIERLGASRHDDSVSGVLAVWVSTSPAGGVYVVGWYKNATVHRYPQDTPRDPNRRYKNHEFGYNVSARQADACILSNDERVLRVPKGKTCRAHVLYATGDEYRDFRKRVLDLVNAGRVRKNGPKRKPGRHNRSADPLRRQQVEQAAIETVTEHYESLHYEVSSCEKDNVGWDLDVRQGQEHLRVEVKGLSQSGVQAELTPNEFRQMRELRKSYRVAIVTDAITPARRKLSIFSWSPDIQMWEDESGNTLKVEKVTGAKLSLRSR